MDDRLITAAAVVVGVPTVLVGYILGTEFVLRIFPERVRPRIRPWLWLLPALSFLLVFLIGPSIDTIKRSFQNRAGTEFNGLANYLYFFTNSETLIALRNSLLWLVLLTGLTVGIGLLIAILADKVKYESVVKSVIFVPMAISFVAASVIWAFMYEYRPVTAVQTGTLNAAVTAVGAEPIAWLQNRSTNNIALIWVGAWMQTGFCMVILSAGLKGISSELLEAARVDGANEFRVFRHIILPLLMPTMAVVATTMIIFALKAFDVVYVLTGGQNETEVIANRMYKEMFSNAQQGRAAAVAVILFLAIIPVMIFNIRRFREQEAMR